MKLTIRTGRNQELLKLTREVNALEAQKDAATDKWVDKAQDRANLACPWAIGQVFQRTVRQRGFLNEKTAIQRAVLVNIASETWGRSMYRLILKRLKANGAISLNRASVYDDWTAVDGEIRDIKGVK